MGILNASRPARGATLWLLVALLAARPAGSLLGQSASEYEVKAAFLYKFAGFVQWPPEAATGPVCIGILGQDPFGDALDHLIEGQTIGGRGFVVKRLQAGANPGRCHIVFVSASEKRKLRSILDLFGNAPVLTVGDMPGFCQSGGMVNFEVADNKVRLQINPAAAAKARLQVSSRLLSLATIVRPAGP